MPAPAAAPSAADLHGSQRYRNRKNLGARLAESLRLGWQAAGTDPQGTQRPVGRCAKILIVIDQFEQWLHAQDDLSAAPLTAALRQCDGVNVQCLLLVRDDFWMSLVRFMAELEVPLVDGENMMAVDLFDLSHAKKVLRLFGQAYEQLPNNTADMTRDQKQFLEDAIAAIQDEGSVSPVRLSLFAEMMKHDSWKPATLRRVGGAEGLGVVFLERCFFTTRVASSQSGARCCGARRPQGRCCRKRVFISAGIFGRLPNCWWLPVTMVARSNSKICCDCSINSCDWSHLSIPKRMRLQLKMVHRGFRRHRKSDSTN